MCELIEENDLPVQDVKDFYSEPDRQCALRFFLEEEDVNQVRDFLFHAQTLNLASTYQLHSCERKETSI